MARRFPGVTLIPFGLLERLRFSVVAAAGGAAPCLASHSVDPYWLFWVCHSPFGSSVTSSNESGTARRMLRK
jgi:hypothetical protein